MCECWGETREEEKRERRGGRPREGTKKTKRIRRREGKRERVAEMVRLYRNQKLEGGKGSPWAGEV